MTNFWMGVSFVLLLVVLALVLSLILICKKDSQTLEEIEDSAKKATQNLSDSELKSAIDKDLGKRT